MKILITGGSGFIGTNLIELLLSVNFNNFINVDRQKPFNSKQETYWVECNLLDTEKLQIIFDNYMPTHVVHLAARTDTASEKLEDYYDNTAGTKSLISILEKSESVKLSVITSTQYVYKSKKIPFPVSDTDFKPHTAYGFSKKITEEYTRNSAMKSAWTIVRPTNVWGPWHMRYPNELWRIIDKGLYFHPGNEDPIKSYAYVKNVAYQIYRIMAAPIEEVDRQVYYVGDFPMHSKTWLNAFTVELTGKKIQVVPKSILYLLSVMGTVLAKMGIRFPLTILRYENMIDNYNTKMNKTIDLFGLSHPDLHANVRETINWVKGEGKKFFPYWNSK